MLILTNINNSLLLQQVPPIQVLYPPNVKHEQNQTKVSNKM